MHITVELPAVSGCSATECAYNVDRNCHARAITIGDGLHPGCDTYFKTSTHTQDRDRHAGGRWPPAQSATLAEARRPHQYRYREDRNPVQSGRR